MDSKLLIGKKIIGVTLGDNGVLFRLENFIIYQAGCHNFGGDSCSFIEKIEEKNLEYRDKMNLGIIDYKTYQNLIILEEKKRKEIAEKAEKREYERLKKKYS